MGWWPAVCKGTVDRAVTGTGVAQGMAAMPTLLMGIQNRLCFSVTAQLDFRGMNADLPPPVFPSFRGSKCQSKKAPIARGCGRRGSERLGMTPDPMA